MNQKIDEIMSDLNNDYANGRLTGVSLVKSIKGGGIKYRYSTYVASHPAHFIGYLTAMCSELEAILVSKHN